MVQVKNAHICWDSDRGFVKIPVHEVRAAYVYDFEDKKYLLLRLMNGSQMSLLPDYPNCELMDYCVSNGYQYCLPLIDEDPKKILEAIKA